MAQSDEVKTKSKTSSIPNQFSRGKTGQMLPQERAILIRQNLPDLSQNHPQPSGRDDWGLSDFVAPQPQSISQKKPTKSL